MSASSPQGLPRKGVRKAQNRIGGSVDHAPERGQDRQPAQFLALGEAYREGRLKIRFLIEDFDESTLKRHEEISNRADHHVGSVLRKQLSPDEAPHLGLGKREMVWDGVLGLDINQSLRGIFALPDSELERLCREVFGDLSVQIQDVVLGPLNF